MSEDMKQVTLFTSEIIWLLNDIGIEVANARRKHLPMNSLHESYAVILEEVDELWDEVRAWQPGSDYDKARKECIQIAAMAVRCILDVCDKQR